MLLAWGLGEIILLFGLFYWPGGIAGKIIMDKYVAILLVGVLAVNVAVFFILHITEFIRTHLQQITSLLALGPEDARSRLISVLKTTVFSGRKMWIAWVLATLLGWGTFLYLGFDIASLFLKTVAYLAMSLAFGLLGAVISVGIGSCIAIHQIGNMPIRVNPLHVDTMGGD